MIIDPLQPQSESKLIDPLKSEGIKWFGVRDTMYGKHRTTSLLARLTNRTEEEVAPAVEIGNTYQLESEATAISTSAVQGRAEARVEQGFQDGEDPLAVAMDLATNLATMPMFEGVVDPVAISAALSSDNPLAKKAAYNTLRRALIFNDLANQKIEATTEPFYRDFDFVKNLAGSITPVYSLISAREKKELSQTIAKLFVADVTEEEFALQAQDILDRAADNFDFFGEGNRVSLQSFLDGMAIYSGSGTQKLDEALAYLDIALLGTPSMLKSSTALVKSGGKFAATSVTDLARFGGVVFRDPAWVETQLAKAAYIDDPSLSATLLANHTFPSAATSNVTRPLYMSWITHTAVRNFEDTSELWNRVRAATGPEAIDEATFNQFKADYLASKQSNGSRQVIDHDVEYDQFGNLYYTELWGTTKGTAYATERQAQIAMQRIGGESVVQDTSGHGFLVVKRTNIPLIDEGAGMVESLRLFAATNPDELGYGFWAKYGSPLAQTTDRLAALNVMAEGAAARGREMLNADISYLSKRMKRHEVAKVDSILTELRDDPSLSLRGNAYTVQEFRDVYYTKYKSLPSKEEELLYIYSQTLNNIEYLVKSDQIFKAQVIQGAEVLTANGTETVVRKVGKDTVPENGAIYDLDTGKLIKQSDIKDTHTVLTPNMAPALDSPLGKVEYYVTTKPNLRRVTHTDVLPRQPGGPRIYADNSIQHIVKQENEVVLANGKIMRTEPVAFMGVRLESEGVAAVTQINAIVDSLRPYLTGLTAKATYRDAITTLKAQVNNPAINRVIASNNGWNNNIGNLDDLLDFAEKQGLDLRKEVGVVSDKTPLNATAEYSYSTASNYRELLNPVFVTTGARRAAPLIGYGGDINRTIPAIETSTRTVLSTIGKRYEAEYALAAINGLIKAALSDRALAANVSKVPNPADLLRGKSLRGKLRVLQSDILNEGSEMGRKLKLEADKIEFRLNQKSAFDDTWENFRTTLGNALYGKGFKGLANKFDMWSANPVTAIRGWVFDLNLGLFAFDQYFVQAMQTINVASIADGITGAKGAGLYPVLRFMAENGNPNVLDNVAGRIAPVFGLTKDEVLEMHQMLQKSGRNILDINIAELGGQTRKPVLGGVREAGRVVFKEGERASLFQAHATAYLEFKNKFPGIKPSSQQGVEWIAHRQNVLRQAMTSASRSPGQTLPGLQFLTYPWRVAEALLSGSLGDGSRAVLTGTQKLKLASAHIALLGIASVPLAGYYADRIYQEYGKEIDPDLYQLLRWGLIDQGLSLIFDTDTAYSSRVAWGEGITSTMFNLMDANFIQAFAGPAGTIGTDIWAETKSLLSSMRSGNIDMTMVDANILLKNIKGWNQFEQLYVGWKLGQYYNRNGTKLVDNVTVEESLAMFLGVTPERFVEMYALQDRMFKNKEYENRVARQIEKWQVQAEKAYRSGDVATYNNLTRQWLTLLNIQDIEIRERLIERTKPTIFSQRDETIYWSLRNGLEARTE